MPVKSTIAIPQDRASLIAGPVEISGFAWSGDAAISRVEVSVDGGRTYRVAEIVEAAGPHAWVRFRCPWNPEPGTYRVRSRAYDVAGNVQPETAFWNLKGYQMNAILGIPVTVI